MARSDVPQPPRPPSIGREFRPNVSQVLGVGTLMLFVLLALFGVFGRTQGELLVEEAPLRLELAYPERFRYKTIGTLEARVSNTGATALPAVTVRFERAFVDAFSTTSFTPSPSRVTDEAYEVQLGDLPAGETRLVLVQVQAEAYWWHAGFVEVSAGSASARAEPSVFVFP